MYVEYDSSEKSTGLTHSLKKFLSPKNRNTQKKTKNKKKQKSNVYHETEISTFLFS